MIKNLFKFTLIAILLTGCTRSFTKDPPATLDFVVVDPDKTPELNLNEVKWQAWNQKRLVEESVKPENANSVFFVLTQDQLGALLDNLTSISDVFAKSIESNQYWQKAVNDYRAKKREQLEESKKEKK